MSYLYLLTHLSHARTPLIHSLEHFSRILFGTRQTIRHQRTTYGSCAVALHIATDPSLSVRKIPSTRFDPFSSTRLSHRMFCTTVLRRCTTYRRGNKLTHSLPPHPRVRLLSIVLRLYGEFVPPLISRLSPWRVPSPSCSPSIAASVASCCKPLRKVTTPRLTSS